MRLSLAHRPCERDHLNAGRARGTEDRGGCTRRRSGRVDVVHEEHVRRGPCGCDKCAAGVRLPLRSRESRLPVARACSREQRNHADRPRASDGACEPFGRVGPAPELTRRVSWDIRDDVCGRTLDPGDNELRRKVRGAAEPVLLPAADERPRRAGVRNRGSRRREAEPPTGTFAAAVDLPGRRRTTTGAERRRQHGQLQAAPSAQDVGANPARDAPARE
jgi:hypothetical protein